MIAKKWIVLLVSVVVCRAGYAENSPLLPRPQKVRYGSGSVALRGMRIMFRSAPDAEVRFAAEELRSWMRLAPPGCGGASRAGPLMVQPERRCAGAAPHR